MSQEKLKTMLMQNLGGRGQIKCIMGNVEIANSLFVFNLSWDLQPFHSECKNLVH